MNTLNQTLQEKFPHLELSVLKLSEVKRDNATKRIDSEFFRKADLTIKNKLLAIQSKYLSYLISFNSRYSQPNYDDTSSLKIINSQYIRNEFIDYENAKFGYGAIVPKEAILINSTGVGTLGRVNINLLDRKFSIDSHINVLIVKDKNELNPCYLMIFLQTKYGQSQINRYYSGTSGQIEIYPRDFNNFLIPLLPMSFQLEIEKLVKDSHLALEQSKALYKEAEDLLYIELGLNPQNPLQSILQSHNNNINFRIATLKESFLKTGRLDSEYYQVKYEIIENIIKSYKGGYTRLGDIALYFNTGEYAENYSQKQKGLKFYIRSTDLKNGLIDESTDYFVSPEGFTRLAKKGDILTARVGAIGRFAEVNSSMQDNIYSDNILCFRLPDDFIPCVYVALFNTKIMFELIDRLVRGSVQPRLNQETLKELLIPKIDLQTQASIASHIQKSFALRAEAKALLNEAKAKVESAISGGGGGEKRAPFFAF
ncbi:restriction endonuclease subunit S [Helicobacter muridarum]|uniref:Restriction endonuclease subunit S n=1 Tax=Helicobacter muridarum TaxID=216 RepID=A0A4U8TEP5_9HELI|nr:restriction endonuclease subunit S [Helicobacter muridarum]TLD98515.1 restriction endonuclease subunit S [Helicobacter muridarum]